MHGEQTEKALLHGSVIKTATATANLWKIHLLQISAFRNEV